MGRPRDLDTFPSLRDPAFHGLAGEIVRAIEPHTEGDPAALLLQFLAAFGFMVGRGPYYGVEADRHYPNLFVLLAGESAKSRKGTTWGWISRLFEHVEKWPADRVKNGLSSGEGFIEQVSVSDDKRLLIVEGEFASVLQMLTRTGNTLSAQLRNAWDGKPLSILTRQAPANAPDGHVSVIGHITADEVRRLMTTSEMGNGFANRFLWGHIRRARILPDGGNLELSASTAFVSRLSLRVASAQKEKRRFRFDDAAHALWRTEYEALSEGQPGLFGAITSRGEAQVVRLALIYSLLDGGKVISVEHLDAALAVWTYCQASARMIFGDTLGDSTADRILELLRKTPSGVTRSQINDHFQRHRTKAEFGTALRSLEVKGLATMSKKKTEGRPTEWWFAREQSLTQDT